MGHQSECRDPAKSNVGLKSDSCSVVVFYKCKTPKFANQAASLPCKTSIPWTEIYSLKIKEKVMLLLLSADFS